MGGDHPVLADDALHCVQLPCVVLARRIGGDVQIPPAIFETRPLIRIRQARPRLVVEL
jgi:hypothetical protein